MRRSVAVALTFLLLAGSATASLAQQSYPTAPVRVLVPFGPGGGADIIARLLAQHLRNKFGQPFLVENKPGAFGVIAMEEMTRAPRNGHTILVGNVTTNALAPILHSKQFKFDFEQIQPVTRLVELPAFLIATTVNFPPTTLPEAIAYAKANPGKVRYSSAGVGSFPHYDMALLARRAGLDLVHVPNQASAAGMLKDTASGDAHLGFLNVATSTPMVRSGRLRALAVVAPERLPEFSEVPTMAELGFPGVGTRQWLALFAPTGVPDDVMSTLHSAVIEALSDPATLEALRKLEMAPAPNASLKDAKAWLADELVTWRKLSEEVQIKFD